MAEFAIVDLAAGGEGLAEQAAAMLVAGFREPAPGAWPDMRSAREEVRECLAAGLLARAAVAPGGDLVGWVGGRPSYGGRVWELHPLVVRPDRQRRGVGAALVGDLERLVAARGALTLTLGTDDETFSTTLGGADLYDDLWGQVARARVVGRHPLDFYRRLGFTITGVVPDANGVGRPDILMSKRVGESA